MVCGSVENKSNVRGNKFPGMPIEEGASMQKMRGGNGAVEDDRWASNPLETCPMRCCVISRLRYRH
ncbi:hypothetical protein MUK42_30654 [Musa troglodytarum]|uniref:Uncharacterized protein n=1 Tax=Musa troglodytarum TaxID=320322 RepID=A0A9E7JYA1_9LILI|nr:hypothetical protein MUK42_30654 [Musa troglodytarum]